MNKPNTLEQALDRARNCISNALYLPNGTRRDEPSTLWLSIHENIQVEIGWYKV